MLTAARPAVNGTRRLPADLEAEESLLGAMLLSKSAIAAATEVVGSGDFFKPAHRHVFGAVVGLYQRGEPADPVTVADELRRGDLLDQVGGLGAIIALQAATPSAGNAGRYARIVEDLALLRRTIGAATEIIHSCYSVPEDVPAALTRAASLIGNVTRSSSTLAGSRPVLVRVADVEAERVLWLWPGRIPAGKITILDGDPGLGKSTISLDLAARVTTGSPMPDGSPLAEPAGVVLLSAEDGIADTIRPRLEAAGADLSRVAVLEAVTTEVGIDRPPSLPLDLPRLEEAVHEMGASLVVIDPLMAFLGGDTNSFRDQDIRKAMHPLKQLAERTGATVILVRHLNKATGGSAVYRGGGSIGIIGAARAALLVAKDPKDEDRRIVASIKSNLGPPAPSMAYRLAQHEPLGCAVVAWNGTTEHTADDLLRHEHEDERTEREDAEDALRSLLSTGPRPSKDVEREMTRSGFSKATTRRAKKAAGIEAKKSGMEGGWFWQLPPEGAHQPPEGGEGAHPQNVSTLHPFENTFEPDDQQDPRHKDTP